MTIEVRLRHAFGAFTLNVAFAVERPGVTALFGASGSGKTTIINALAGLIRPDEGRIVINGRVMFDSAADIFVPPRTRRIGYVFQDARLFPHMSVQNNLLYGWRRAPVRAPQQEIDRVVALLGLETLLNRTPHALSGGETSRVALGRALLASPEILLLDEPLAALDNARRAEILPYLERLRDETKLPMLYVSHAVEEVARLAQDVVMIESGRVVAEGSVFEVLTSLDFAQHAGTAPVGAVIEAVVGAHRADDLTALTFGDGVIFVPALNQPAGSRLRLRIAAQDIMLALEEPRAVSANNVLPARVVAIRSAGTAHADIQLALGATRLIARITRASAERLALAEGMPVFAVIKSVTIDPRMLPRL